MEGRGERDGEQCKKEERGKLKIYSSNCGGREGGREEEAIMDLPEDILLKLCLPGSLEGGVLRPHWEGDPGIIQYLPT